MRYLLVFALLLLAVPVHAQNHLSLEDCLHSAQVLDELFAERDSAPYSESAEFEEKQEFLKRHAEEHVELCLMPYWCDDVGQAETETHLEKMKAIIRYCGHQ